MASGAIETVCLRGDVFGVEGAIAGVEARYERFETWRDACDQRDVERGLRPNVEVRQGVGRIGGEVGAGETDYPND